MTRTPQRPPATLEEAFGRKVSELRESRGLSQTDLAAAAGYSLRYVGDLERGTKSATLRTMNDVATLLNVNLGTLIEEAEELLSANPKPPKAPSGRRPEK